jgi:hypothetical protein
MVNILLIMKGCVLRRNEGTWKGSGHVIGKEQNCFVGVLATSYKLIFTLV